MPSTNKPIRLICEDASHLGGPMGTEYTSIIFSKGFDTIEQAKAYASTYQKGLPDWATWDEQGDGRTTMDSGAYIWTIKTR